MAPFPNCPIDHHQPNTKGITKQVSQSGTRGTSMMKYPDTLFPVYSTPSSRERPGTQVKKLLSEQKVESRNAIIKMPYTPRETDATSVMYKLRNRRTHSPNHRPNASCHLLPCSTLENRELCRNYRSRVSSAQRLFGLLAQEGDEIISVLGLLQATESHLGAGNVLLWVL
jgi:hypothetical protein